MIGKIQGSNLNFKALYIKEDDNMKAARAELEKRNVGDMFEKTVEQMKEKLEGSDVDLRLSADPKGFFKGNEVIVFKLLVGDGKESPAKKIGSIHPLFIVDYGVPVMMKWSSEFAFESMLKGVDALKDYVHKGSANQ